MRLNHKIIEFKILGKVDRQEKGKESRHIFAGLQHSQKNLTVQKFKRKRTLGKLTVV